MIFASILDSLQDVTSVVFAVRGVRLLFLLLKGFERV